VVLKEINDTYGTDFQQKDIYFAFDREIMTNAADNAQIELTDAQKQQIQVNTMLGLANTLDDETIVQSICEILDIDYTEIKDKLPQPEEDDTANAKAALAAVVPEDEPEGVPGDVIE
jgi:uncharacterized protein YpuA (DUF1002 family)